MTSTLSLWKELSSIDSLNSQTRLRSCWFARSTFLSTSNALQHLVKNLKLRHSPSLLLMASFKFNKKNEPHCTLSLSNQKSTKKPTPIKPLRYELSRERSNTTSVSETSSPRLISASLL